MQSDCRGDAERCRSVEGITTQQHQQCLLQCLLQPQTNCWRRNRAFVNTYHRDHLSESLYRSINLRNNIWRRTTMHQLWQRHEEEREKRCRQMPAKSANNLSVVAGVVGVSLVVSDSIIECLALQRRSRPARGFPVNARGLDEVEKASRSIHLGAGPRRARASAGTRAKRTPMGARALGVSGNTGMGLALRVFQSGTTCPESDTPRAGTCASPRAR